MIASITRKALICAIIFAFMSCSGGSSDGSAGGSSGSNRLRLLNTIPDLPIIYVYIDDSVDPIALLYGVPTEYESYGEDTIEVRVLVASSPLPLIDENLPLTSDPDKTLIFFGDPNPDPTKPYRIATKLVKDLHIPQIDNRFDMRVINSVPGSKSFDVYVTDPNVPLDNVLPFISGINFKGTDKYFEGNQTAGVVTFADSKTQEVFYVSDLIDFAIHPVITFYVLSLADGGNVLISWDSDF